MVRKICIMKARTMNHTDLMHPQRPSASESTRSRAPLGPSVGFPPAAITCCFGAAALAPAAGAPPAAPTVPITVSGAYFCSTSGGWIMSNSALASLPANVRMASSPPGWSFKKLVTFRTCPCNTTQQSSLVVCLATSSKVYPAAAGAAAVPAAGEAAAPPVAAAGFATGSAPARSFKATVFMSAPSMYSAHALPATRPKATQSSKEEPPRRLLPWTPPATSPAAYKPGITLPLAVTTSDFAEISRPPMQ
mmetsp:Transcript_51474/g.112836  ORF Transcript_51474/g.112836 Transcript_51474/m.112836 type:complete len:249 (-) Transcript_51474:1372-2118(-)